jgi:hypothetical protein
MARYYMHLFNSIGSIPDEEGVEAADTAEAVRVAAVNIRSLLSEEVKGGVLDLRGRIEIEDAAGDVVRVVPFREAIELIAGGSA